MSADNFNVFFYYVQFWAFSFQHCERKKQNFSPLVKNVSENLSFFHYLLLLLDYGEKVILFLQFLDQFGLSNIVARYCKKLTTRYHHVFNVVTICVWINILFVRVIDDCAEECVCLKFKKKIMLDKNGMPIQFPASAFSAFSDPRTAATAAAAAAVWQHPGLAPHSTAPPHSG